MVVAGKRGIATIYAGRDRPSGRAGKAEKVGMAEREARRREDEDSAVAVY